MNLVSSPDISFRGTTLLVDGETLTMCDVSYDQLHTTLNIGRRAIIDHIESIYARTVDAQPDTIVVRPSLTVVQLSPNSLSEPVLSGFGAHNRTSVYLHPIELLPGEPGSMWGAVSDAGYTPEARRFASRSHDLLTLCLRNPETDPAPITTLDNLPRALGFVEPDVFETARETYTSLDTPGRLSLISDMGLAAEAAVTAQSESYPSDPTTYGYAQIGSSLAITNLRVEILGPEYALDPSRYTAELSVISMLAYRKGSHDLESYIISEIDRVSALL